VHRKLALVLAILIPGGLIALACALLFKTLARTERGRKVVELARNRVSPWMAGLRVPAPSARQAA